MNRAAILLGLTVAGGCGSSPTGVVVVMDSDLAAGAADGLRVVVGTDRDLPQMHLYDLEGPEAITLPASFGIVGWDNPRDPEAGTLGDVVAIGDFAFYVEIRVRRRDEELFTTSAASKLVVGRTTRLDIFVAQRCLEEWSSCDPADTADLLQDEARTCSRDGCSPVFRDAGDLRDW